MVKKMPVFILFSSLLCTALLGSLSSNAETDSTDQRPVFVDVSANHWAYDTIQEMAQKGYFKGVGKNQFEPNRLMNESEFAILMGRIFHKDPSVSHPHTPLTRLKMAEMLYNQMEGSEIVSFQGMMDWHASFSDIKNLNEQQQRLVGVLSAVGLFVGDDHNRFLPNKSATRAEVAVVAARLLKFLEEVKQNDGLFKAISFKDQNYSVGIYWGLKPTLGYDVVISHTVLLGNQLHVYYKTSSPPPGSIVGEAITLPGDKVVVPEVRPDLAGEVKLVPLGKELDNLTVSLERDASGKLNITLEGPPMPNPGYRLNIMDAFVQESGRIFISMDIQEPDSDDVYAQVITRPKAEIQLDYPKDSIPHFWIRNANE